MTPRELTWYDDDSTLKKIYIKSYKYTDGVPSNEPPSLTNVKTDDWNITDLLIPETNVVDGVTYNYSMMVMPPPIQTSSETSFGFTNASNKTIQISLKKIVSSKLNVYMKANPSNVGIIYFQKLNAENLPEGLTGQNETSSYVNFERSTGEKYQIDVSRDTEKDYIFNYLTEYTGSDSSSATGTFTLTQLPLQKTMGTKDMYYIASFKNNKYTLTVQKEPSDCDGSVYIGETGITSKVLKIGGNDIAYAANGIEYEFEEWKDGHEGWMYPVTMPENDLTLTAIFKKKKLDSIVILGIVMADASSDAVGVPSFYRVEDGETISYEEKYVETQEQGFTYTGSDNYVAVSNFRNKSRLYIEPSGFRITKMYLSHREPQTTGGVTVTQEHWASSYIDNRTDLTFIENDSKYEVTIDVSNLIDPAYYLTLVCTKEPPSRVDHEYRLTVTANPSEAGNVYINSSNGTTVSDITENTSVTVHATENANYIFTEWTEEGIQKSTSKDYTFVMPTKNLDLIANYEEKIPEPEYITVQLIPTCGEPHFTDIFDSVPNQAQITYKGIMHTGGALSPAGVTIEKGDSVTLRVPDKVGDTAGSGTNRYSYNFQYWTDVYGGGSIADALSSNNPVTFTPSGTVNYYAVYSEEIIEQPGDVTITAKVKLSGTGTVSVSCDDRISSGEEASLIVDAGKKVTLRAIDGENYEFMEWEYSSTANTTSSASTDRTLEITANEDALYEAKFRFSKPTSYTLKVTKDSSSTGIGVEYIDTVGVTEKTGITEGTRVIVVATPGDNTNFVQWSDSDGGEAISKNKLYMYTMPAQNKTLYAKYELNDDEPVESSTLRAWLRFDTTPYFRDNPTRPGMSLSDEGIMLLGDDDLSGGGGDGAEDVPYATITVYWLDGSWKSEVIATNYYMTGDEEVYWEKEINQEGSTQLYFVATNFIFESGAGLALNLRSDTTNIMLIGDPELRKRVTDWSFNSGAGEVVGGLD